VAGGVTIETEGLRKIVWSLTFIGTFGALATWRYRPAVTR
jgi:hypothetical protein